MNAPPESRLMVSSRETTRLIIAANLSPPGSRLVEVNCANPGAGISDAIPLAVHFRLLRSLTESSADETLHLSMRRLAPGTTDFVIDTLAAARDLEEIMRRVARGYNHVHGGYFNRVERRGDRLVYSIDDKDFPYAFNTEDGAPYAVMEGLLIFLHALLSIAMGGELTHLLRGVRTRRSRRTPPDGFLSFWESPVRCRAPCYALEYEFVTTLHGRRPPQGSLSAGSVYDMVDAMIAKREQTVPKNDLRTRVVRAITAGVDDQRDIAGHLGVSVATMRRRLAEAGVNFRDLRNHVLNEKAIAMLRHGRSVGDVALALGFVDVRSFSRAFKSWNSVTPTAFCARPKD